VALILEKPELVERLEEVATAQRITPEDLLTKVVSEYLDKIAHQKIQSESVAFEELHNRLVTKYLGDYVAIHNGDVVDHDPDVRTLHLRIRRRFGRTPILLRLVKAELEQPDLVFRSPKLEPVVK
jgi:hypothetical protein